MLCVFTQTGSCVSESGAAPLSAGIFMKPTLILIGLSHNTAHWCPLPDSMSDCPQTKFTCENVVYNVPDYCFTLTCLSKSYIYLWIPNKYKLPVRTKYFKAWKVIKEPNVVYRGQDWGQTHLGMRIPFSWTTWHQDPTGVWHFSSSQSFSEAEIEKQPCVSLVFTFTSTLTSHFISFNLILLG